MASDGTNDDSDRKVPVDDQWKFPGQLPGVVSESEPDRDSTPVELCRTSNTESELIAARLAAVGIPCAVDREMKSDATDESDDVIVQVRASDLEIAREVLNQPVEADDADEAEESMYSADDYIAQWKCPSCRRGKLELVPLSKTRRYLRRGFFVTLLAPVFFAVLEFFLPVKTPDTAPAVIPSWLGSVWLGAICVWAIALALMDRAKVCTECGWESGTPHS